MTPSRTVSSVPSGTAFSRYVMGLAVTKGNPHEAIDLADRHFKSTPQVAASYRQMTTLEKTAVAGGTTSDSNWASPLAAYGISGEFIAALQSASIYGRLQPFMHRVPFRTLTPKDDSSSVAYWVREGYPVPTTLSAIDSIQQEAYKAQGAVVVTRELLRLGDPLAERTIRDLVVRAVRRHLDAQFLDPSVTASASNPASITNGAAQITATGGTAAQVLADLESMIDAIQTSGDSLRWVMSQTTYARLAAVLAGAGVAVTPGFLLTIPVTLGSTASNLIGSPRERQITLLDSGAIAYSVDDDIEVQVSTQGTVQMNDSPTNNATTGTGTTTVSLFQASSSAIKASLYTAWQRVFEGSVSYMTVSF